MVGERRVKNRVSKLAMDVLLPRACNSAGFITVRNVYFARGMLVPKVARGQVWHGIVPVRHISELITEL